MWRIEIEEEFLQEKEKDKKDLQNIKNKQARDELKEKNKFKVKARVEKNHSLLDMWFKDKK